MMIAYLDRSAFDHVYGKVGCSAADIACLRKAIYGRELSLRLSLHTLEEILLGRRASPQAMTAQIKLTLSLANSRALVKPCEQLLRDDIRSYAARGEAERPFLRGEQQNAVAEGLAALIESDGAELEDDFVAVLEEARRQKGQFLATLGRVRLAATAAPMPSPRQSGEQAAATARALEQLAERAAVGDACRQRGWDGLFKLKTVRLVLAAAASNLEAAAAGNLHHALAAAAVAQTLVSDDAATRRLLEGIALDGFEVIGLPEFLTRLPR